MATKKGIVNRSNSRSNGLTTQRNVRPVRSSAMDTFQNQLARLGSASENIISAATYPLTRLSRNYQLLNSLYRNSWICNKIVNTVPEDMMKNGWALTAELKPEETDRINKLEQKTLVKEKLLEGLYWGRLYGGAGAIMMIDGHEDKLDEPLDYDDILPGSFCGLMVVDRWSGIYPGLELIKDIRDPEFGMPEFYEVRDTISEKLVSKVHHSRVLRFTGKKLPFWEEMAEIYWGSSVMEHVFEELLKRDSTSWNIASLVFQANLLVDQVEGLDQMQAATDPEMQRNFYNIKSAQNQMRSNNGMMIVGKSETISAINYTFAGLEEISESQMMDISGACDIPMTRLFGRSPAGMNATGESDMQMYTDMIGQQQNKDLRPKLNKLYPVLFMSEFGEIPKDLGVKFNPVSTPTEDKASDTVAKKVESISNAWNDGAISQKMYLRELHELSYVSNMFTSIGDKDIERASDEFGGAGESMPDLGLFGDNGKNGGEKGKAADAEWNEDDHPRKDNGEFGAGSGGSNPGNKMVAASGRSDLPDHIQKFDPKDLSRGVAADSILIDLKALSSLLSGSSKQWFKSLSIQEKSAINQYCGSQGSMLINEALRSGESVPANLSTVPMNLSQALQKTSLPENIVTYRRLFDCPDGLLMRFRLGGIFTDPGFVSSTLDYDYAAQFGAEDGINDVSNNILLEMHIPKGANAVYITKEMADSEIDEKEILLNCGSSFRVESVETVDMSARPSFGHVVMLEVVG